MGAPCGFPFVVGPFDICSRRNWWAEGANSRLADHLNQGDRLCPLNYNTCPLPLGFSKILPPHALTVPTALHVAKKRVRGTVVNLNMQKIAHYPTKLG